MDADIHFSKLQMWTQIFSFCFLQMQMSDDYILAGADYFLKILKNLQFNPYTPGGDFGPNTKVSFRKFII